MPSVAVIDLMKPLLVLLIKKYTVGGRFPRNRDIARKNSGLNFRVQSFPQAKERRHSSGDFSQGAKMFQHSVSASVAFGLKRVENVPHPWALAARRACQMLIRPQAGDLEGEEHLKSEKKK